MTTTLHVYNLPVPIYQPTERWSACLEAGATQAWSQVLPNQLLELSFGRHWRRDREPRLSGMCPCRTRRGARPYQRQLVGVHVVPHGSEDIWPTPNQGTGQGSKPMANAAVVEHPGHIGEID